MLIVDDNIKVAESYSDELVDEGYDVKILETIDDAINELETNNYDVCIIDMDFPGEPEGGIRIVDHIQEKNINTKAIILTGKGSVKNFRKVFTKIFDYIEKDENAIDDLIIKLEKAIIDLHKDRKFREYKQSSESNEQKTPVYQSAHTFEKCFNTPIRNICYRLQKKIPYYYNEALSLINEIDQSIDIWANQFSMELVDARYQKNQKRQQKQANKQIRWIDSFEWSDFENDFKHFVKQYFIMNINDLFDHYDEQEFKNNSTTLFEIYNGDVSWKKFIDYDFQSEGSEYFEIMGIRSYFNATMVNMISNAIEAMNFFDLFTKKTAKKEKIQIRCKQEDHQTIVTIKNTGATMDKDRVKLYNNVIFRIAKEGNLKISNDVLENLIYDKRFTTKAGIGSGMALIHAARYFSRIYKTNSDGQISDRGHMELTSKKKEKTTSFTITMPFGKLTTDRFKKFNYKKDYYQPDEANTYFHWPRDKSSEKDDNYKELVEPFTKEPDDQLSDVSITEPLAHKDILIVEDSRPDRFRIRMLIDDLHIRHYRFAWDAKSKKVLSVDSIIKLIENAEKPIILILDLSWTPYDDCLMNHTILQHYESIKETVANKPPHSFQLLEKINVDASLLKKLNYIIILSQYISPVANGLKEYIKEEYKQINPLKYSTINKWRDEDKFDDAINSHI